MSASRKKVIVRKLSRDWLAGYITSTGMTVTDTLDSTHVSASGEASLELLDLAGKVTVIALAEIKWVCFVRDFNSGEPSNPERLLRRNFAGRPRGEGLWLRLRLKDNDLIEGLAGNDASFISEPGLFLAPPDARSNTQRIFVPRCSIAEFEVLAVIGAGSKRRPSAHPQGAAAGVQEDLFRSLP